MYLAGYSAIDIVSGLIYALSFKLCLILKFSQTEGLYFYSYIERQLRQYAAARYDAQIHLVFFHIGQTVCFLNILRKRQEKLIYDP